MKICIVITTYNRLTLLKECINNILSFRSQVETIIVVNNNSSDGTEEYLSSLGGEIIALNLSENIGGSGGFMKGIQYFYENTQDDAVWILDDDTMLNESALTELQSAATSTKKFGFLASNVRWIDGTPAVMNIPGIDEKYWTENQNLVRLRRATFVSILVPRDVVGAVGYPIPDFFIWGDDTEYTQRISREYPCYFVSKSCVMHKTGANFGANLMTDNAQRIPRYFYAYRNRVYNARAAGRKQYIRYLKLVFFEIFKVCLRAPNHRLRRLNILLKGTIAGFSFHPTVPKATHTVE
ncbi:glycosyltransferase family 2 protein [Lactiplantibacillus pentosus]|uniref:glycosyltransferase family 2 protein n=1 Tax=Lactobacillaceae TaxID=33958 RepID=UPI001C1F525E|nr:glycosyltransferase family 2 protein [Lactiplantibacillus pentosus]MBU7465879.1 glycosyltransferase family 2 protein [Lactiplantibacillus pentosus]MDT7002292.1 glycosyltransferase family 2 protein [Lactiplantibacillus pentosus]